MYEKEKRKVSKFEEMNKRYRVNFKKRSKKKCQLKKRAKWKCVNSGLSLVVG